MLDWNPGALVTTLLTLTIGTLIGSEFSRYFYRPRVIVRYKEIDPNFDASGVYWSLQIENMGRTVAQDCLANITLFDVNADQVIDKHEASLEENLPNYDGENLDLSLPRAQIMSRQHYRELRRTSLCWSKIGNPESLNINPGVSQSVDICKFHRDEDGSDYYIFPSEIGWRSVRVRIKKEEIKGYVLICPANEFPTKVYVKFRINKDGESALTVTRPNIFERFRRRH